MLCDIPEEWLSHLHSSGTRKSCMKGTF